MEIKLGNYEHQSIDAEEFAKALSDSAIPWVSLKPNYRIAECLDINSIEFVMRLNEVYEWDGCKVRMLQIQLIMRIPSYMMEANQIKPKPQYTTTLRNLWDKRIKLLEDIEGILPKLGWAQFDGNQWFKRQPYTFIDGKLSKNGEVLTIVSQEFGTLKVDTRFYDGMVSCIVNGLKFFEELSLSSPSFKKVRDGIRKSAALDMSIISIAPCGQTIEISIYDLKFKRKVISSYMASYGVSSFLAISKCLTNPKYYTEMDAYGAILSFDMQAVYKAGLLRRCVDEVGHDYELYDGNNSILLIDDSDEFIKRFKASFEDETEAAAAILKLELG